MPQRPAVGASHERFHRGRLVRPALPDPLADAPAAGDHRPESLTVRACAEQGNGFQQIGLPGAIRPDQDVEAIQLQRLVLRSERQEVARRDRVQQPGAVLVCRFHRPLRASVCPMARPENSPRGDCQRLGQSETAGLRLVSINNGRLAIAHSSRLGTHRQCSERRFRMFRGLQHCARRSHRPKPAFFGVLVMPAALTGPAGRGSSWCDPALRRGRTSWPWSSSLIAAVVAALLDSRNGTVFVPD